MIRKSDWDAAAEAHLAERRQTVGPPPTAEEVSAFFDGTLSPAETERIREMLICYPDLASVATAPIEENQDRALVSDSDFEADWNAIAMRVGTGTPKHHGVAFWRSLAVAAAIVVVILSAVLVQTKLNERRLDREVQLPQPNVEPLLLLPDGGRGPNESVSEVPHSQTSFLLVASLINARQYPAYRVEITSAGQPVRTIWTTDDVVRAANDTVTVLVPRAFLPEGRYTLVVYGRIGTTCEPLATYTFRIPSR